jgi:hypothetical protein
MTSIPSSIEPKTHAHCTAGNASCAAGLGLLAVLVLAVVFLIAWSRGLIQFRH